MVSCLILFAHYTAHCTCSRGHSTVLESRAGCHLNSRDVSQFKYLIHVKWLYTFQLLHISMSAPPAPHSPSLTTAPTRQMMFGCRPILCSIFSSFTNSSKASRWVPSACTRRHSLTIHLPPKAHHHYPPSNGHTPVPTTITPPLSFAPPTFYCLHSHRHCFAIDQQGPFAHNAKRSLSKCLSNSQVFLLVQQMRR